VFVDLHSSERIAYASPVMSSLTPDQANELTSASARPPVAAPSLRSGAATGGGPGLTLDWEPAAVAGLARALIATGFATAGPYNHLALNPALCPYLRRALAADQRVGLEARWQQARLHRPDARQPRSWVLTAHPAPANLRQSNLDAQVGLEFLFVRLTFLSVSVVGVATQPDQAPIVLVPTVNPTPLQILAHRRTPCTAQPSLPRR
jgi:hypothetical protein